MPNLAVVIGIDRYATDLTSLEGAVADAQGFASWLVESGEVFAPDLLLGLLRGDFSLPDPTSLDRCRRIGTTLPAVDNVLTDLLTNPPPNIERLYFYFSGHGASSRNAAYAEEAIGLEGFTDTASIHALELSSLLGVLDAIPARERFILIDGCRDAMFSDNVRFGGLSRRPPPAPGQRRNFILRATGPGRKAAEVEGRGLFTRHLCSGLRGAGSAKRWDPYAAAGEGGYTVRWRALAQYVASEVMEQRVAQRYEQLTFEQGEHPADADPELAKFSASHFRNATITVRLTTPETPPESTRIFLRRNDSADPDRSQPMPVSGRVDFEVPPSAWVVWAQADGWQPKPRSKPVYVYAERVEETVTLVPEPSTTRAQAFSPFDASGSVIRSGSRGPEPMAQSGSFYPTIAGERVSAIRPAVRVSLYRESGEPVADPLLADELRLPSGIYRVRLDVAGGGSTESSVLIDSDDLEELDLQMPDMSTPALVRMLEAVRKQPPVDGFATPVERLGRLAAPSVATVAALAVAQAVNGEFVELGNLAIGHNWAVDSALGVEMVVADEHGATAVDVNRPSHVLLSRMGRSWHHQSSGELRQMSPLAPVESASIPARRGGWWLQLCERLQPRGYGLRLATRVFPRHITLVIRHESPSGAVDLHQYAVRTDVDNWAAVALGLVEAEAFQRTLGAGRDPTADPGLRRLTQGEWFEPITAMLAAAALLDQGDAGDVLFDSVFRHLIGHGACGPDMMVLRAAHARRRGRDDLAAVMICRALRLDEPPMIRSLLERLQSEVHRLDFEHDTASLIVQALSETVGRSHWTLCRENSTGENRESSPRLP